MVAYVKPYLLNSARSLVIFYEFTFSNINWRCAHSESRAGLRDLSSLASPSARQHTASPYACCLFGGVGCKATLQKVIHNTF